MAERRACRSSHCRDKPGRRKNLRQNYLPRRMPLSTAARDYDV